MKAKTDLADLAGPRGRGITRALDEARRFLTRHTRDKLLAHVGQTISQLPKVKPIDKAVFQRSYYGGEVDETDDLLAAHGLFYVTEQRKLFLDCTSGHYQMTWGYDPPELTGALLDGIRRGIVWDGHSNIPQWPVKRLAQKLVEIANPDRGDFSKVIRSRSRLNTVLLGVCTGSVACEAVLKMMLMHYRRAKPNEGKPVIVALDGNYHGTSMFAQRMRGMWPEFVRSVQFVIVQPNDCEELERAFSRFGERVAGFWAEPVMMNREAILIERDYLRLARRLCDQAGACMVLDEIQTGFWYPEVFMFRQHGIVPDFLVVGKGMTAGLHPLAAVVYKRKYDRLEQYDAISTNGNAPLAALVALRSIAMIERDRERIGELGRYYFERLQQIPAAHPARVVAVHGKGLLAGLKFRRVHDALTFHPRCVEHGLWVRVHAYHEGHSTVLTKLGLCADKHVADFIIEKFMEILRKETGNG